MHDPGFRNLAVVPHPQSGAEMSRYFLPLRSPEELLKRSELIETACREGGTLVVLAKVVGSDALFGLLRTAKKVDEALGTHYYARVVAFYDYCYQQDLSFALAQTDVKGDRTLRPSEQEDPDLYLRIVEERPDGIVVRGAKVHTSNTTHANEMIVLPTRAMGKDDKAYAVAFAIPLATKGLKLITQRAHLSQRRMAICRRVSALVCRVPSAHGYLLQIAVPRSAGRRRAAGG